MNLTRAIILLTVLTLVVSTCHAARSIEKRKKKRRKQRRQERRGKAFTNNDNNNSLGNFTGSADPADMATILGTNQCGDNFDVTSLFNSMFLSKEGVTGLVRDTQEELTMTQVARVRRRNSYVVSNRISKSVGILTSPVTRGAAAKDTVCCETRMNITAPGMVMVDGKLMSVVHMNHSYQFVQEGECVNPGTKCRDIGLCSQIYKYAFLLLYDPELVGKVNPPVRYGRVPIKSHCECMNIGRVL